MYGDDENTIYKLTFFATDKTVVKDDPHREAAGIGQCEYIMPTFVCPLEFHDLEEARRVATFWMSFGFFDAVRCDSTTDNMEFSTMKEDK